MAIAMSKPAATPPAKSPKGRRGWRPGANLKWSIAMLVVAVAAFVFYYQLPNLTDSINSTVDNWAPISAINECLVYAIMALGLNIVVGYAGLLDLGYVAFWAIGTYVGAWLMSSFWSQIKGGLHVGSVKTVATIPGIHFNFWLVLLIGALVCAGFGILIGAPTLRLRGDYLALVTLAFGEIIPAFFRNGDHIFGQNITNGTRAINPVDPINPEPLNHVGFPDLLGLSASALPFLYLILCALVAFCVFVSLRIRGGRLGRSWLAIREDELAANMMGVSLVKAKLSAYAVGAAFGGLGGVAYSETVGGAFPDSFQYANSIFVLIMVVIGGMGNVWGVLIGAVVLDWINNTGLNQLGTVYNSTFNANIEISNYNFLVFGVILVLMMLFRREGLLPERRTRQIMREPSRTEMESLGADVDSAQALEGGASAEAAAHTTDVATGEKQQ
ncbi:branched-chain amino acid ABC transporter permease [uncultured Jatrophihabitans sp.]|uniref:branched-chain amino acid ABC transporter permease n=1 Tax=uncultured Jatrophihabitans sp. TaxID=1610747 RepID=UPI0035CAA5FB